MEPFANLRCCGGTLRRLKLYTVEEVQPFVDGARSHFPNDVPVSRPWLPGITILDVFLQQSLHTVCSGRRNDGTLSDWW